MQIWVSSLFKPPGLNKAACNAFWSQRLCRLQKLIAWGTLSCFTSCQTWSTQTVPHLISVLLTCANKSLGRLLSQSKGKPLCQLHTEYHTYTVSVVSIFMVFQCSPLCSSYTERFYHDSFTFLQGSAALLILILKSWCFTGCWYCFTCADTVFILWCHLLPRYLSIVTAEMNVIWATRNPGFPFTLCVAATSMQSSWPAMYNGKWWERAIIDHMYNAALYSGGLRRWCCRQRLRAAHRHHH